MRSSHIRDIFRKKLAAQEFVDDKSGVKLVEIIGSSFIADEPSIFGQPNQEYINREIEWYNSQSLCVDDIPGDTPKIWNDVASDEAHEINSNYGFLIYSRENHEQYEHTLRALASDPSTRRALCIYTRPTMQFSYNRDGMSDFICTNSVQYMIRDNKLHAIVNMRSNDVIFGYRNDYAWQKHVLDKMVHDYNVYTNSSIKPGNIMWQTGSLHVYEQHFHLIK